MLPTTVAPAASSGGRSSTSQVAAPRFCNPTLLSMPPSTEYSRGGGLPGHGSAETDLTTTAPSPARST